MRWIRRTLLAAAVAAAVGAIAVAVATFLVVPRPEFQSWLGGRLARAVGPGVDFGSASPAFWPAPGIRLHEVTLGDASPDEPDGAATVGSLTCTLSLRALLGGEVALDRIYVEKPVLSIERDAAGRWIFGKGIQQILDRAQPGEQVPPAADAPPAAGPGSRRPPALFVREGEVSLADRRVKGGPVTLHIRKLDADLEVPHAGEPGHLRIALDGADREHLEVSMRVSPVASGQTLASAAFRAEVRGRSLASDRALLYLLFGLPIRNPGGVFDIEGTVSGSFTGDVEGSASIAVPSGSVEGWGIRLTAPVRLAASFAVKKRRFSMHGARLDAPAAAFAGYASERTAALFAWEAGGLHVEQLDLDAYGGAWKANGSATFGEVPAWSLEVAADEVSLHGLAKVVAGEDVGTSFETLSGKAAIEGEWTGPDTWQAGLHGSGEVHLAGGQVASSPVVRSLFTSLFGKIPGAAHLAGGKEAAEAAQLELESLDATFALRDARASTQDLVVVTSDYRMEGKGSMGLDGSLQLSTRVALAPHGVKKVYMYAAVPFRKPGNDALPAVPVQVSGSIGALEVVPDVTGISLTPFRMLFGSAEGAFEVLRGAATPDGRFIKKIFGAGAKDSEEVPEGDEAVEGDNAAEGGAGEPAESGASPGA